jgi:hypothetical protein
MATAPALSFGMGVSFSIARMAARKSIVPAAAPRCRD